ncbi:MAG: HAMP domain-containing histidine kinase, partial [Verrucomicrobia bacterium]|nr:HAMP domain-containing histidine kinase [Verrucomicrobiota bacterium]
VLMEEARRIDQDLTRKTGAYKAEIGGAILSVRNDGLALLYTLPAEVVEPLRISSAPDGLLSERVVPGYYASIPAAMIEDAKQEAWRQYRTGNVILALMACLGLALIGATITVFKRQSQLEAARTGFIATVSHELRTPLSLIRLHAETLHHGRISEDKIHNYHQTILTEAERLTGIVNNVLDFSRIERNKLQIHLEPTDLSALCERIVDSFLFRLEQDGFALEKQIQPEIVALADPLAFSQIVFNLVDNAIKYSDEEKTLRIELESSKNWNILRVSDHGIGIPDKLKKKIFDDFVRSDDRKVTARRGSGIGLSVARRLTEKMNGTIEVEDNEPTGSVFTVKLGNGNETTGG